MTLSWEGGAWESRQPWRIDQKSRNSRGKHDMEGDPAGSRVLWSFKSISDIKKTDPMVGRCGGE